MLCSPFSFSDVKIRPVKKLLKNGKIDFKKTCIDETGALCDGSLVKFRKLKKNPSKLADLLANRKEIINHIHGIVEKSK
tara:strand:+ start:57 stop:293 length:237 start_codon:yes stop_codon:yes gene_type:complete